MENRRSFLKKGAMAAAAAPLLASACSSEKKADKYGIELDPSVASQLIVPKANDLVAIRAIADHNAAIAHHIIFIGRTLLVEAFLRNTIGIKGQIQKSHDALRCLDSKNHHLINGNI